jgi:hypothetical protein
VRQLTIQRPKAKMPQNYALYDASIEGGPEGKIEYLSMFRVRPNLRIEFVGNIRLGAGWSNRSDAERRLIAKVAEDDQG